MRREKINTLPNNSILSDPSVSYAPISLNRIKIELKLRNVLLKNKNQTTKHNAQSKNS